MSTLPDIDLSEYEEVIEEPAAPATAPEESEESEGEKEKGNRESSIIGVTC